jgi:hypothetical protein
MNEHAEQQERDRVRRHTSQEVLDELDEQLARSIRFYATQPDEVITARIEELDREWDMERWLETNASTLALTGAFLGLVSSRKWFLLTGGVLGFLLQHATTGWCPPLPVFRRLGVRTRSEIDREKFALKALRGDFREIPGRSETGTPSSQESAQALHA